MAAGGAAAKKALMMFDSLALGTTARPSVSAALWAAFFVLFFVVAAVLLGPDASFDFRNYHFYNGFAALHDRGGRDIFPAQLQTTFFSGLDAVYYALFAALNQHPNVLVIVLSLAYAVAGLLVVRIGRLFVEGDAFWRGTVPAAAALVGLTGAATLSTLSATQSDVVPGLPLLAGLALWLTLKERGRTSLAFAALVGALGGLSVGLKLTQAPLFVGMFVAMCLIPISRRSLAEALAFGVVGVAAFAIVDGAWLLGNWRAYGNPIFPLRNDLFRSDLVAPEPWTDRRFLPTTLEMTLFYPAYWAFYPSKVVSEWAVRDTRILLGCVGSIVILVVVLVHRLRGETIRASQAESAALFLAIAFLVAYVAWQAEWSIYRYLAIEEALSGVLVLAALMTTFRKAHRVAAYGLFALICVWTVTSTYYPQWDRAPRGRAAVSVTLPPIEGDAMFLFLDGGPFAYLVPFMPETVSAVGVRNNIATPGTPGRLNTEIENAIREHHGPFWGVEDPSGEPGRADATLSSVGLARAECTRLVSNIEFSPTSRICRLVRQKSAVK